MRYASPEANPPDPATNSATTAPTSARPPEMRRPVRKYGRHAGSRSNVSVRHRLPPYRQNRSANYGGAEARPVAVFANTGKNATIIAHTTSEANGLPTQTMINGAIATIGVTCKITAHGWIAAWASRLADIAIAIAPPMTADATSAAKVTDKVDASDSSNPYGSCRNADTIA